MRQRPSNQQAFSCSPKRKHASLDRQQRRAGIATVEFAIMAPVLTAIFLTSINVAARIDLKHNLTIVAHVAAVELNLPSATFESVENRYEDYGKEIGIHDIDLTISWEDESAGIYKVEASAPEEGNNPLASSPISRLIATRYGYR